MIWEEKKGKKKRGKRDRWDFGLLSFITPSSYLNSRLGEILLWNGKNGGEGKEGKGKRKLRVDNTSHYLSPSLSLEIREEGGGPSFG